MLTRAAAVVLGALALWAGAARAQDAEPEESIASREIFARHAQGVAQVQIQEAGSSAKRSIGSGFAVSPAGLFVTNSHVVSAIVDQPERYQVRIRDSEGVEHPAELVAFDVVQDLALLRSAHDPGHLFALHDSAADPLRNARTTATGRACSAILRSRRTSPRTRITTPRPRAAAARTATCRTRRTGC